MRGVEKKIIGSVLWSHLFKRVYGSPNWSDARKEENSAIYSLTIAAGSMS